MRWMAALLAVLVVGDAASAQTQGPPTPVVVAMAQHFVLDNFPRPADHHFDLAFDLAQVHPEAAPDSWSVVGGFMAKHRNAGYRAHIYIATVRLVCPDHGRLECWRLRKLTIDRAIVVDQGQPS
ncbi:MAG: hypothetical protein ACR2PO_02400 [Methyloligellaceae bacterium]